MPQPPAQPTLQIQEVHPAPFPAVLVPEQVDDEDELQDSRKRKHEEVPSTTATKDKRSPKKEKNRKPSRMPRRRPSDATIKKDQGMCLDNNQY